MSAKTIFIIVITVLVTIILMKNTDEVTFWLFGDTSVPKLAVLGCMFGLGFAVGFAAGRPRKKTLSEDTVVTPLPQETDRPGLSEEDNDYIR